jgi:membrane protein required for colicin V production
MNWLDIVIIVALVIPTVIGLKRGLIRSVLFLVGLIIGIILAGYLYKPLANLFTFISNENVANIIAFIIILLGVMVIAAVLSRLLKFLVSIVMLGWVDHLGGAVFGFLMGAVFWSVVLAIWVKFFGTGLVTNSFLAAFLLDKFPLILGLLPGEFDAVRNFFQ